MKPERGSRPVLKRGDRNVPPPNVERSPVSPSRRSWRIRRRYLVIGLVLLFHGGVLAQDRPNVILILTDDQGYGDLGSQGNPFIQTPHLDRFYTESVRLTDFHVDPVCTPTRAALLTGRYSIRTGAWRTGAGRAFLRRDEVTLADVFAAGGYRTGMFGKWMVEVAQSGRYELTLRQLPREADFVIQAVEARLKVGQVDKTRVIPNGATAVKFAVELSAGPQSLQTWFTEAGGKSRGAFYVEVQRMDDVG